jgi:hypothetical protein
LVFPHSLGLAKSQAHCATNLALFKIRTGLHRSKTSSLEFPLDQATIRFVLLGLTILAKSMIAIVSFPGNGPLTLVGFNL